MNIFDVDVVESSINKTNLLGRSQEFPDVDLDNIDFEAPVREAPDTPDYTFKPAPEDPTYTFKYDLKSEPYREFIEEMEIEHGLPRGMLPNLIGIESDWRPKAVSEAGAGGLMQLMPETAKMLGVKDVFDPYQNIRGGVAYLMKLKKRFGTWEEVWAAYNMGPTALAQGRDYPQETLDYVKRMRGFQVMREASRGSVIDFESDEPIDVASFIEDIPPRQEDIYEDFIKPTAKAVPKVLGAVAGGLALFPGAGIASLIELLPKVSTDPDKFVEWGSLDEAMKVYNQVMSIPSWLITTPEEEEALENIALVMKPIEMAGEGWRLIGELANEGLRELGLPADTYLEPLLATYGEAAAIFALPEVVKSVGRSNWYRGLTIKERGLVVQSLAETLQKNPNMTEGELLKSYKNPMWREEALTRRSVVDEYAEVKQTVKQKASETKLRTEPEEPLDITRPSDAIPTHTFTSQKGHFYELIGGRWYNQKGKEVTNKYIIKAAEKKKVPFGEDEAVTEERVIADIEEHTGKRIEEVTDGEVDKYYAEKEEVEKVEPVAEGPLYRDVKPEAQEVFDALDMPEQQRDKLRRKRKIKVIEHKMKEGEPIKIPPTWHDGVFRYTAMRTPKGGIVTGEAGSYDTIMMPGAVAGAKEGPIPAGHTLYLFDTGVGTDTLRIYRAAELKAGVDRKVLDPEEKEAVELFYDKRINELSEKEVGLFLEEYRAGKHISDPEVSGFFQDDRTIERDKESYAKSPKAVESDPYLLMKKLINDVNRWHKGDNSIDIMEARNSLDMLRDKADDLRDDYFAPDADADHLAWKNTVTKAAKWAREVGRLNIEPTDTTLYSGIPLNEMLKVARRSLEFLDRMKNDVRDRKSTDQKFGGLVIESRTGQPPEPVEKLEVIETEFKLDKTNLLPTLLKDISNQNPSRTMIYELMQNALDAFPSGTKGKIDIQFKERYGKGGRLVFKDTGTGMSPQEVKKFFLVGGSIGKTGTDTRGGYGLAKIALLLIPEKISLTTVKGGIMSRVVATREQIYEGTIKIVPSRTRMKDGTTFRGELPKKLYDQEISSYSMGQAVKNVRGGTWTDSTIRFRHESVYGDSFDETFQPGTLSQALKKVPSRWFDLKGSEVGVHFVETEPYGYSWGSGYEITGMVTNKGLIVDIPFNKIWGSRSPVKPDFMVVVDFEKTPSVRAENYPFLKNRTDIDKDFADMAKDIIDAEVKKIISDITEARGREFGAMVERSPVINGVKILIPYQGEAFDIASDLINKHKDVIESFSDLTRMFNSLLSDVGDKPNTFHLTIDPNVFGYKSNKKLTGYDLYAINPFRLTERMIDSPMYGRAIKAGIPENQVQADLMVHTLVHEYSHLAHFDHASGFAFEMARVTASVGHESLYLLSEEMRRFYDTYGDRINSITKDFGSLEDIGEGFQDGSKELPYRRPARDGEGVVQEMERAPKKDTGVKLYSGPGFLDKSARKMFNKLKGTPKPTPEPPEPFGTVKAQAKEIVLRRRSNLNLANYETNKFINSIEQRLNLAQRETIHAVIEKTDIPDELGRPDLQKIIKRDKELLEDIAKEVGQHFKEGWKKIKLHTPTLTVKQIEDYVTHLWEIPRHKRAEAVSWFQTQNRFLEKRFIDTYKEGIEKGFKPKVLDISEIIRVHDAVSNRAIENVKYIKSLLQLKKQGIYLIQRTGTAPMEWIEVDYPALTRRIPLPKKIAGKKGEFVKELKVRVHPDLVRPLRAIFEQNFDHPVISAYEAINGILKKSMLSVSLFHHGALGETGVALIGLAKTANIMFNPVKIYKALAKGEYDVFKKEAIARDSIEHGGVQYGATADIPVSKIQGYLDSLARSTENTIMVKRITKMMRDFNAVWDKALWNYLHDTLKLYGYEALVSKLDPNMGPEATLRAKREIGQVVNDTFGGQNWDTLMMTPKEVQMLTWSLLSADWTFSTTRQALAPTGIGKVYKESAKIRRKAGRRFWFRAGLYFGIGINALNALFRSWDMEENPQYYRDREYTWLDKTMFGNTLGKKTKLFVGRYKDGSERYLRWGKQFIDFYELVAASLKKIGGKAAPIPQLITEIFTGHTLSGFKNDDIYGKKGLDKTFGILKAVAKAPIPFALRRLVNENIEFKPTDIFMPSSKGMSRYRALEYFKKAIIDQDIDLLREVYEGALRNNLPAYTLFSGALSWTENEIMAEVNRTIIDIRDAQLKLQSAHTAYDRRRYGMILRKLHKEKADKEAGWRLFKTAVERARVYSDLGGGKAPRLP